MIRPSLIRTMRDIQDSHRNIVVVIEDDVVIPVEEKPRVLQFHLCQLWAHLLILLGPDQQLNEEETDAAWALVDVMLEGSDPPNALYGCMMWMARRYLSLFHPDLGPRNITAAQFLSVFQTLCGVPVENLQPLYGADDHTADQLLERMREFDHRMAIAAGSPENP